MAYHKSIITFDSSNRSVPVKYESLTDHLIMEEAGTGQTCRDVLSMRSSLLVGGGIRVGHLRYEV